MLNIRDSLLLVGAGKRLLKVRIENAGNLLVTRNVEPFVFNVKYKQRHNQIYALCPENDSILWIGIRGNGVVRFNLKSEKYQLLSFDKKGIAPINDILCIHQDRNGTLWLGSSYGITRLTRLPNGKYACKNFNETDGLSNNTIHGILEDAEGKWWLSSNAGIILFDTAKGTFRSFNRATGLKITEFSDKAYYKDESNQTYFFGRIDGLVWIKDEQKNKSKNFTPGIFFPHWHLTIYAKIVYVLLFLWAVYLVYYILRKKYESRKLKL
ncbi:MAG: hypothetical protein LBH19_11340 [Dysgonamonadaceae bacterium]|nr:hypothetical protein [Dysgonamonadaceae bacterium]